MVVVQNRVKKLKKESSDLNIVNTLDQYGHREHFEFVGIKDSIPQADIERFVINLLDEIEIQVTQRHIVVVHRLGRFRRSKKRNIVIKVVQRKDAKIA